MPRPRSCLVLVSFVIGTLLHGAAHAEPPDPPGSLSPGSVSTVALPGGLRGALTAIGDPATPDRSRFLLEIIRRAHHSPVGAKGRVEGWFRALLNRIELAARAGDTLKVAPDLLPLPLSADVWTQTILGGTAGQQPLLLAILSSRSASLMYYGLLALDEPTRIWIGGQPALLQAIAVGPAPAFVMIAPALRVQEGAVLVPGGAAAAPAWEALTGRRPTEPVAFTSALLSGGEGTLAYFYAALSALSPAQLSFVFGAGTPDAAALRQVYAVFQSIASDWSLVARAFYRPPLDPALLVADLRADAEGRPMLPGTRKFWSAVFADERVSAEGGRSLVDGDPVDFVWLSEQLFGGQPADRRRRYHQVLFASRGLTDITPDLARDALDAVGAVGRYPALAAVLERAMPGDVPVLARAARRADDLSAIGDKTKQARALAQFQGLIVVLTRAASRRSLSSTELSSLVASLSDVELGANEGYEGRLVRWIDEHLRRTLRPATGAPPPSASEGDTRRLHLLGPVERDLVALLAGRVAASPTLIDWEGTRYRVDATSTEAGRLVRLLGEEPRPYVSSARSMLSVADALEGGLDRAALNRFVETLKQAARDAGWAEASDADDNDPHDRGIREAIAALRRASQDGQTRNAKRLAPPLRNVADELLARGLLELVYAVALGQAPPDAIPAPVAAQRHDFGRQRPFQDSPGPWEFAAKGNTSEIGWHMVGSIIGLEVKLADFSLLRLSLKPPSRKPGLSDDQRRVFVEAVPLVESDRLMDADRDGIVSAIRQGRDKFAAVQTPAEAAALADHLHLDPWRRTLLPWMLAYDPDRRNTFLSVNELFQLGLGPTLPDDRFHAWGTSVFARQGCLCLRLERRSWDTLTGRWGSGMLATAFPDLNLRLAELLAEMHMPASLLGPVLASAALDLVTNAACRDPDDRRGLTEFVHALSRERVEQYLALLTTNGPLVPVGPSPSDRPSATAGIGDAR